MFVKNSVWSTEGVTSVFMDIFGLAFG